MSPLLAAVVLAWLVLVLLVFGFAGLIVRFAELRREVYRISLGESKGEAVVAPEVLRALRTQAPTEASQDLVVDESPAWTPVTGTSDMEHFFASQTARRGRE